MNAKCEPTCRAKFSCPLEQNVVEVLAAGRYAQSSSSSVPVPLTMADRHASRRRFSPSLSYGRDFAPPLPTARLAAVMILLERRPSGWTIPLTLRPTHLPDHPGQVCLPGGRVEPNEDVCSAAEREFCEELGFDAFPTRTLGQLQSIYIVNSDFYLTPSLAVIDRPLDYCPDANEVESIVHLPVEHLLDLDNHILRKHMRGRVSWTALGIEFEHIRIWGATAIVLGELAAILQRIDPSVLTPQQAFLLPAANLFHGQFSIGLNSDRS